MHYQILAFGKELEDFRDQWNSLALRSDQRTPMLSFDWLCSTLTKVDRESFICVLASSDERLVAVIPLLRVNEGPAQFYKGLVAPFNKHLNITDILVDPEYSASVLPELLNFLFLEIHDLAFIEFARIPEDSCLLKGHCQKSPHYRIHRLGVSTGYFLDVPSDYSSYEASLSRNFRNNLNKATNKLNKLENIQYSFLDKTANPIECLDRFCQIEKSGWKGRRGTAIANSDTVMTMYKAIVIGLQEAGVVEWHFLSGDGKDLAGHMAFRYRDRLVLWKLSYNENYANCSPGNQLLREIIKRESQKLICAEIDLTTDQNWYQKWKMRPRPYIHVRIYRRQNVTGISKLYVDRLRNLPILRKLHGFLTDL